MFYQFQHFGLSEYFCKEYEKNFSFPSHLHQSFEFITVLSGEMNITVDRKLYVLTKGESLLIFPHQIHSLSSKKSKHMLCIFSSEIVMAYFSKMTKNYVNQYRINNACYILNNSNCSILQCALDSGYTSLRSFNRNFKSIIGITPNEYRKSMIG